MGTFNPVSCSNKRANLLLMLLVLSTLLIPFNVLSQKNSSDSVTFYSHTQLDSLLNAKVSPERVSRLLGRSKDNEPYLVIIRTKPGDVEIHEAYDDVAIIRSGHGKLKTGNQVKGQRESGAAPSREWLGGAIQESKERNLSPGDFIVIPAMLGHQYIPNSGETLTYWTIKVKRPTIVSH